MSDLTPAQRALRELDDNDLRGYELATAFASGNAVSRGLAAVFRELAAEAAAEQRRRKTIYSEVREAVSGGIVQDAGWTKPKDTGGEPDRVEIDQESSENPE